MAKAKKEKDTKNIYTSGSLVVNVEERTALYGQIRIELTEEETQHLVKLMNQHECGAPENRALYSADQKLCSAINLKFFTKTGRNYVPIYSEIRYSANGKTAHRLQSFVPPGEANPTLEDLKKIYLDPIRPNRILTPREHARTAAKAER
jgi:hypothetical protein